MTQEEFDGTDVEEKMATIIDLWPEDIDETDTEALEMLAKITVAKRAETPAK